MESFESEKKKKKKKEKKKESAANLTYVPMGVKDEGASKPRPSKGMQSASSRETTPH